KPQLTATDMSALWRDTDFVKLWTGQAISQIGSMVTLVGLPLAAALSLHAAPSEMGILAGTGALALLFAPFAGAWADRFPRRQIMILTDLARAVLLASIPVAAALGRLKMAQLYGIEAASVLLTVLFDVSYQAFVPALVGQEKIVEANAK